MLELPGEGPCSVLQHEHQNPSRSPLHVQGHESYP